MQAELVKKLRYKEGRAVVINAPDGYRLGIEEEGALSGPYDFLQLFVHNAEETDEWIPKVMPLLKEDAVFWITYPKQSAKMKTDINRDRLAAMVQNKTSYRAVGNVAVDEKWSALRFRPVDLVKPRK